MREIGYTRAKYGFDADTCSVITSIDEQSPDIALGVDKALEVKQGKEDDTFSTGAGDQGNDVRLCLRRNAWNWMPITISLTISWRASADCKEERRYDAVFALDGKRR